MLILSRKKSQRIYIGRDIRITVVAVSSGHVKIGIEAPRGVPIDRPETHLPQTTPTPR